MNTYVRDNLNALRDGTGIANGAIDSNHFSPTCGTARCSSQLNLTTSYQDVAGCSVNVTPTTPSYLLVWITVDSLQSSGRFTIASIAVDGAAEESQQAILMSNHATGDRATVYQFYKITLTAAAHTIKMRGKAQGANNGLIYATHTSLSYMLVSQ